MRFRVVPVAVGVRMNSTCDEPGGRSSVPAIPHDTTTRCGGSTSTYSPRMRYPLMSTANSPPRIACSSARWPIHNTIRSAVTRCANTTSGGASMSIEVENSAMVPPAGLRPPGLGLGRPLETRQVRRPELIEEGADCGQAVRSHDEQVAGAPARRGDQARDPHDPQAGGDDMQRHPTIL